MPRRRFPISLVMIVRDEAASLGRCLDSVTGLVDEIVVVDTGSSDDTVAIATSYGAKVHHFTWIDDFAAARNFSLSHATHPWRLVLDADNWILDPEHARAVLDRVGQQVPDFTGFLDVFQVRSDGSLNEDAVADEEARLLPSQLRYSGRIHEQVTPKLTGTRLGIRLGHDGYSEAAMVRKDGRNTNLLIASLEDEPTNAYLWYQLGSEYVGRLQHEEAIAPLIQAFNLLHPGDGSGTPAPAAPWVHKLTCRLMLSLTEVGRHAESVAVGEMEAPSWTASSAFHYILGSAVRSQALSLRESDRAVAEELMLTSMGLWIHATTLEDRQEHAGVLKTRPTVLAAERVAQDYATMGDLDSAERYRRLAEGEQTRKSAI